MKNLIYSLLLVLSTLFSCSVEEIESQDTFNTIDLNANDVKVETRTSQTSIKCIKKTLIDANGEAVGNLVFTVMDEDVKVMFKTTGEYGFIEANLSLSRLSLMEMENFADISPVDSDFTHKAVLANKKYRHNFMVDKTGLGMYSRLAAHAVVVDGKGEPKDVWSEDWASFVLADFSYCGDWPDEDWVSSAEDVDYFAPLTPETSGVYPAAGISSDVVTLTPDNNMTEGFVEIPIYFSEIPDGFNGVTISIDFKDLDLQTDVLTAGNNVIEFYEEFTLIDNTGKFIAELDSGYGLDGDFTWEFPLPDYIFTQENADAQIDPNSNQFVLYARISAHVALIEGSGVTVQNTIETMENMTLRGDIVIK